MHIKSLDHIVITTADIDKGYPIEEGIVKRHGALGKMQSIYLRDADGNLIEIAVYEK